MVKHVDSDGDGVDTVYFNVAFEGMTGDFHREVMKITLDNLLMKHI